MKPLHLSNYFFKEPGHDWSQSSHRALGFLVLFHAVFFQSKAHIPVVRAGHAHLADKELDN